MGHTTALPPGSLETLARDLRDGRRTALALAEACLDRQERFEPLVHAYKSIDVQAARRQAQAADAALAAGADTGALMGIPISVKDLFGVNGHPTYAGTPRRLGESYERDGSIVGALRSELAVFTGKTHTVEIAFGGLGTNPHWGTPRNPWDAAQHRVPGGSSAGAAVSIATGSALVALGSDTAGSVRVPASMCGCVGLKTTAGRWPTDGVFPLAPTFDTVGVLARSARDAAIAFTAIERRLGRTDARPSAPADLAGVRLGVSEQFFWSHCDPGVADALHVALRELEAAGARLVPLELEGLDEVFALFRKGGITAAECHAYLTEHVPDLLDSLDPAVAERVRDGTSFSASELVQRRARLTTLGRKAAQELARVDALAVPTVPITPPLVAELENPDTYRRANRLALRNTSVVSLLGLCGLSLPAGLDAARMPVGLQLVGAPQSEERLLAVAQAIEARIGTAAQRLGTPPLVP